MGFHTISITNKDLIMSNFVQHYPKKGVFVEVAVYADAVAAPFDCAWSGVIAQFGGTRAGYYQRYLVLVQEIGHI